jgi:predicted short-subunit dehydrogenase-like oxidoreductase (DUF2520 family)
MKIVFIGAGNLAGCVSMEMQRAGMKVAQICSRTPEHAQALAKKLNCPWTSVFGEVIADADIYIFAIKDSALAETLPLIKPNGGLWVHTAGSVPMDVFKGYAARYGVFYPLQTFTKARKVMLDGTPIFLEVSNPKDMKMLKQIAIALSGNAQEADSQKRQHIHLAAVFACNFSNHMYTLAAKLLAEQGIDYNVLLPLIAETAGKIVDMTPQQAQTGPATRNDRSVISKQLEMLGAEPGMQTIYKLISQSIYTEKIQYE